jgi:hypothetical protein
MYPLTLEVVRKRPSGCLQRAKSRHGGSRAALIQSGANQVLVVSHACLFLLNLYVASKVAVRYSSQVDKATRLHLDGELEGERHIGRFTIHDA